LKTLPPPLHNITQETSLKIIGVNSATTCQPASDHIRNVVSESAKTLYALRVLRCHGLSDAGLQEVLRAVVISRLTYASTAWSGFVTATDIQRVDAFLRRSNAVDSAHRDYQTSTTSWRSATADSSVEFAVTSNMSYTGFFRHLLSLYKTTICDPVDMTDSYQLMLVMWRRGVVVTTLVVSTKLLYVEPG